MMFKFINRQSKLHTYDHDKWLKKTKLGCVHLGRVKSLIKVPFIEPPSPSHMVFPFLGAKTYVILYGGGECSICVAQMEYLVPRAADFFISMIPEMSLVKKKCKILLLRINFKIIFLKVVKLR